MTAEQLYLRSDSALDAVNCRDLSPCFPRRYHPENLTIYLSQRRQLGKAALLASTVSA